MAEQNYTPDPGGNVATSSVHAALLLHGTGAPSNDEGRNGDGYINDANGNFYKKTSGAWVLQT